MKNKSIINMLRFNLIFIVLSVSLVVVYSNYYILQSNIKNEFLSQKNKVIEHIKKAYIYPMWELNVEEINTISKSYLQNDLIDGIEVVSMPDKSMLFKCNLGKHINIETVKVPIVYKGGIIGYVSIKFNKDVASIYAKNFLLTNISLVLFIIILIYFSTDMILRNKLQEPMSALVKSISRVKEGDYDYPGTYGGFVEFKPIFDSVKDLGLKIKKREEELKKSEEKFRNLAENAPLCILIYQGEKIMYCNRVCEYLLGYTKEEMLSKKFWEFAPCEIYEMIREHGIKRQKGKEDLIDRYEFQIITKDGEKRLLDFTVSVIDYEGSPAVLVIVQDITEQRRNQIEVEKLRNMLQNIINSMPSMLITVDEDFKIVYWNRFVERFLGSIGLKDLRDKNLFEVFHMGSELKDRLNKAINSKDVQSFFRKSETDNGAERFENITIFPLKSNGIDGAVIKIDDITEQIRFEEMLIHSEKMITIGNMASGIAHEINNPLAIIMQACDVCCNRLKDSPKNREIATEMGIDFDALKNYITQRKIDNMLFKIKEATKRASDIIRGLLTFTQGSSARMDGIDIREVMDKTLIMAYSDYSLKKKYDMKKIKIIKEYKDVPKICCDPTKMQQVFLNIIKNSAQAMANVDHPEITIKITYHEDMVKINIKDNGPGIPKDVIGNIFDPFYTTKQVGEGVGLGLYISYFIVTKQHNGKIFVDSAPDKGTSVSIYLPISPPKISAQ